MLDMLQIKSYQDYLRALKESPTEMFWVIPDDVAIDPNFKFDIYFSYDNEYDRNINHVFLNGEHYDGVMLMSKNKLITEREFNTRFLIEHKEWDLVASTPKPYDKLYLNLYQEYQAAVNSSSTEMFWVVPEDLIVDPNFKFDIYFSHHNIYDRNINHVFLNGDVYDGIMLLSKNKIISKREFDSRFLTEKKEWNVLASTPTKYDIFNISTYEDYLNAVEQSSTNMFWAVWNDVILNEGFTFEYQVPRYNQHLVHVFKNGNYFDGVCLLPKCKIYSKNEVKFRFFIDKKEVDLKISNPKNYDIFEIDSYDEYQHALEESSTDLFWMTSKNIKPDDDFKFDLYFSHHQEYERKENHAFLHKVNDDLLFNGIFLLSKFNVVSAKEINYRFLINRKEWNIVASGPRLYDVFNIDTYAEYLTALEKSITEMFWVLPNDVIVDPNFKFDICFSHDNEYDRNTNHVFLNSEHYDGVMLMSKHRLVSEREFNSRFLIERKEWDLVVSKPKIYDKFYIDSYQEYQEAVDSSSTEMFWVIPNDVILDPNFKFDIYFSHHNIYDRNTNHVFLNGEHYDGVMLMSKHKLITEREFNTRFLIEHKEWDLVVSTPSAYDKLYLNSYQEYQEALSSSSTGMLWVIPNNIVLNDNFKFDIYFSHHNIYDRNINHVFLNGEHYDGVMLLSKNSTITEKEFNHRFIIERKEWDVVASNPKPYDEFYINSYQEYLEVIDSSSTEMFWVIPNDVVLLDDFKFDMYFTYDNIYDRNINHVFLNGEHYDGVMLMSKHRPVSEREFKSRFLIERKEWDLVASNPKPYDIIFISYNELTADLNFKKLYNRFPRAIRVQGVKGIHQAHAAAAKLSTTSMFWVVDADAEIVDNFEFNFTVPEYNIDQVYVWKSKNPINSLEYGYGGVKLIPKKLALEMNIDSVDMTTSISKKFNVVDEISNITSFNTDPFSTWKSAFRECVKLSSKLIEGQIDEETTHRLAVWCSVGADKLYGLFSIAGAVAGRNYGQTHKHDADALRLINDFDWLRMMFDNEFIANSD